MHITRITLDEFRRYHNLKLTVPPAGLRIVGKNASGKSSVLEALLLLATTKSNRAGTERELIRWDSGKDYGVAPYARVFAHVVTSSDEHDLEIRLEESASGDGSKKSCLVDDRSVRATTMVGVLKAVEFSPEDVQLVSGAPADRRRQLDVLISQIDRRYMQTSSRYVKVLSQRNGLLRGFARNGISPNDPQVGPQLAFWDNELVHLGASLIVHRTRIVNRLAERMRSWSRELLVNHDVDLEYSSGVPKFTAFLHNAANDKEFAGRVQDRFARELQSARADDVRRGTTTIGPQRDDINFRINGRSLAAFGSRGQQRLGVVALKLSEADIIESMTGEKPLLLLDDVLSELDESHASWLLTSIANSDRQLLLTSAVEGTLEHRELKHLELIQLDEV